MFVHPLSIQFLNTVCRSLFSCNFLNNSGSRSWYSFSHWGTICNAACHICKNPQCDLKTNRASSFADTRVVPSPRWSDECRSMILTVWCVSVFPVCFRRPLSTSRQLIIIQEPGKSRKEDRVTNHILWTKVISTWWLCPQIWKVWLKIIIWSYSDL